MASQPDDTNRKQEAAAAVLLLAGTRYNLPGLIKASGIKPRPFRRISPTETLRADMAAPYFQIVRLWRDERAALLEAYIQALPTRGVQLSPAASANLQRAIDEASARVERRLATIARPFPRTLARLDQWHRAQFIQRIKASTGLDVSTLTSSSATASEVQNAIVRVEQLARAVHVEIGHKVGTTLLNSLAASVPATDASVALSGTFDQARARAARVGVDQTEKAVAAMSRARRVAAGLQRFRWRHDNTQRHPRPVHVARDMRVYSEATAPNDRAGTLPFCRCFEEPLFD